MNITKTLGGLAVGLPLAMLTVFGIGSIPAFVNVAIGYGGGGGGGWYYAATPAVPAVPANQIDNGCKPGNIFSTTTGKSCTVKATPATPAVPGNPVAQGRVLGASTFSFTRGLALGSRGDDVTELQNRLIAEGFLSVEATGYFGKLTKAAVIKFQEKNGLEQVGNVGPKTRTKLNSGVAVGTGSGNEIPGCAVGNKFNTTTGQACPAK